LLLLVLLAPALRAEFVPIGRVQVESFDEAGRDWRARNVELEYQARPESLRLDLDGPAWGQALRLRLDPERLPHYREWMAAREREGGAAWGAMRSMLGQMDGKTLAAMTFVRLPREGDIEVLVGLRQDQRFEQYVRVRGHWRSTARGAEFQPRSLDFVDARAALLWELFRPIATREAARAAGQTAP
jgi:hypothetical protein